MTDQATTSLQRVTLLMVLVNAFTTPLMLSSVNVALPSIARDLSLNAVMLSWVPMAYLMASAMFVLIFGRIADMFGRKRIFLIGTSCVIVSSLMAAMAENGSWLITARFMQGVSAAMLYATQVAIVSSVYPAQRRGQVIGLTVSMIYLGLTAGPLLGGAVIDIFGWRASFLLHIPLAFFVLGLGIFRVKGEWLADERGSFDLFGTLLYAGSILIICMGVSYLPGKHSFIFLVLALLGLIFFFLFERVHKHPIFNVNLFFTNRVLLFSCLASLVMYTATFANVVQVSLYLQYLKGLSATMAGSIMMCQPLTMALFSPLAGRFSDRVQPKYLATSGMVVSGLGLGLLSYLHKDSSLTYLVVALVTTGLGFGLFSSPNVSAIMGSVDKKSYGSINGIIATMRIVGQMSSMVLVTLIFALIMGSVEITPAVYPELEKAIRITFTIAACLCLLGIAFSLSRGRLQS